MASLVHSTVKVGRILHIDGLLQEKRNSIANALELHLSCTNHDGLVQESHNSSVLALELCLSCTNPLIYFMITHCLYKEYFVDVQGNLWSLQGLNFIN